jgi:hypothetical protein
MHYFLKWIQICLNGLRTDFKMSIFLKNQKNVIDSQEYEIQKSKFEFWDLLLRINF